MPELARKTTRAHSPPPFVRLIFSFLQHAFRLERQIDPLGPMVFTLHDRTAGGA